MVNKKISLELKNLFEALHGLTARAGLLRSRLGGVKGAADLNSLLVKTLELRSAHFSKLRYIPAHTKHDILWTAPY
jgi:hypothetical protein